jgi:hypothetical protein
LRVLHALLDLIAPFADLHGGGAVRRQLEISVQVIEQGRSIAQGDMNVGQQQTKRGIFRLEFSGSLSVLFGLVGALETKKGLS